MKRTLIASLIIGMVCTMGNAVAQPGTTDDPDFRRRDDDTVHNNCRGACSSSVYGPVQKTTFTISSTTGMNGARPASVVDACTLAVSFKMRSCVVGGVKYTDVVILGLCTMTPCILAAHDMMQRAIVRSLVPDNPLSVIDPSVPLQVFTWILPPCWTSLLCTATSPPGTWNCMGACECVDSYPGVNTLEQYCRKCCVSRITRSSDGSCHLTNGFDGEVAWAEDCLQNGYNSSMWPALPITGISGCPPLSGSSCEPVCPFFQVAIVSSIPTAP